MRAVSAAASGSSTSPFPRRRSFARASPGSPPADREDVVRRARRIVEETAAAFPGDVRAGLLDPERSEEADDAYFAVVADRACPMLELPSGRCRIYEERPVTCRTYGFAWAKDGAVFHPPCGLNLPGAPDERQLETSIDIDRLDQAEDVDGSSPPGWGSSRGARRRSPHAVLGTAFGPAARLISPSSCGGDRGIAGIAGSEGGARRPADLGPRLDRPLDDRAVLDEEGRRVDLGLEARPGVDLDPLAGVDDAADVPGDREAADVDLGVDRGAVSDDELVLRDDLPLQDAVDPERVLEGEGPLESGSPVEEPVQDAAPLLPADHPLPPTSRSKSPMSCSSE